MIKVLEKTFDIIEAITASAPTPVRIIDLSRNLKINNATCARILSDLVNSDYIVQVSRHEGYTIGPRLASVSALAAFRPELTNLAHPVIDELAIKHKASVLLTVRCRNLRYIIYSRNESPKLLINLNEIGYDDLLSTATGLLLASNMEPKELDKLISGYTNTADFITNSKDELNKIKKDGEIVMSVKERGQGICAFSICKNGILVAALGGSLPFEDFKGAAKNNFLNDLRDAAKTLTNKLTMINTIG